MRRRAIQSEAQTAACSARLASWAGAVSRISYFSAASVIKELWDIMSHPTRSMVSANASAGEQAAVQGHGAVAAFWRAAFSVICNAPGLTAPVQAISHHC